MKRQWVTATLMAGCLIGWCSASGRSAEGDGQSADEVAIREAVTAYVAAFNRSDADALAAMWSPYAVYINPLSGDRASGREAIKAQFAGIFANAKGSKLVATTNSIQFISPGVAVEQGTAKVIIEGEEPAESNYSAIYVKHDDGWLLDRITEKEITQATSNYDHLKDLEWMIGTWVDEDEQVRIETTCKWTKNRNFITRMFSVIAGDQIEVSGMQIVGWDPAAEEIRSWVFDSDGGFGEGTWSHKENAWYVQATGVATDGSKSSATNILTYVDENRFTWQSVNRSAGGQLLPNVGEVMVVRQAASE